MPYPEQREHEEFAAKKLVCLSGENFRFDRRGNDSGKPDVLFSGACILGVEITFVSYQGDADKPDFWVKDIWDFARNPQFDQNGIYRTIDPKTRKPKILDNQIERLTCFCQRRLSGSWTMWNTVNPILAGIDSGSSSHTINATWIVELLWRNLKTSLESPPTFIQT
jgi:hypothetical protein